MTKEKTNNQKKCEKWLRDNGYEYSVKKNYISKTVYHVKQGNFEIDFELPYGIDDMKRYMHMVGESWDMKREIERLRTELGK